jgi:hypothetical protein
LEFSVLKYFSFKVLASFYSSNSYFFETFLFKEYLGYFLRKKNDFLYKKNIIEIFFFSKFKINFSFKFFYIFFLLLFYLDFHLILINFKHYFLHFLNFHDFLSQIIFKNSSLIFFLFNYQFLF